MIADKFPIDRRKQLLVIERPFTMSIKCKVLSMV